MSVLFCDTDCELWFDKAQALGLKVIQMPYIIDGEEIMYDLGEKCDIAGFYKKMRAGASALTAGLNEQLYLDYFEPYFEKGEDILYIAFSSHMSGTFKYLDTAIEKLKAKYPNVKFRIFDTLNISMGAGIQVYLAAKFYNENGKDIDKTYEYLEKLNSHVKVNFVVDDMKYLARGGRISPAKAKIGNFLQIKPVIHVKDGELDVATKANGTKKAHLYMIDQFAESYQDYDGAPVYIVNADCPDLANEFIERLLAVRPDVKDKIVQQPVGPVIGAHCGPGTIGFIYTCK